MTDDRKLYAVLSNGDIVIDAADVFAALTGDQFEELIHRLGCAHRVLERAIDFLCDDDSDGWYDSTSVNDRQALLERVEQGHIAKSKYNWLAWTEIRNALKAIRSEEHIYWRIYHHAPESVREWLRNSGAKCNYATDEADADIKRIETMINEAFAAMGREET